MRAPNYITLLLANNLITEIIKLMNNRKHRDLLLIDEAVIKHYLFTIFVLICNTIQSITHNSKGSNYQASCVKRNRREKHLSIPNR